MQGAMNICNMMQYNTSLHCDCQMQLRTSIEETKLEEDSMLYIGYHFLHRELYYDQYGHFILTIPLGTLEQ